MNAGNHSARSNSETVRPSGVAPSLSLGFVSSLRRWGGGEKWMLTTACAMRDRGHRVTLIVQPGSELAASGSDAGLDVVTVRLGGWFDPRSLVGLAREFTRARIDVICANLDKEIRQARLGAWLAGRRVRLVARRGSPDPIKSNWDYRFTYTHGVDRLICNAEALVETVCGPAPWFDRSRVHVIPNGVDVVALERAAATVDVRAELKIPRDSLVVGCVGEVGWRKAQEHVLTAAESLRERFPEVIWLIAGEGSGLDELTADAGTRGLLDDGRVRFLGFRRDVPAVLAACDVLVLPSRYEGFPNTLLEGMALGLPVAASRADGIPELVVAGETGLLHAVDDVPQFVDDVAGLLQDSELRRRFGDAGRRRAQQVFGQQLVMDQAETCLTHW